MSSGSTDASSGSAYVDARPQADANAGASAAAVAEPSAVRVIAVRAPAVAERERSDEPLAVIDLKSPSPSRHDRSALDTTGASDQTPLSDSYVESRCVPLYPEPTSLCCVGNIAVLVMVQYSDTVVDAVVS